MRVLLCIAVLTFCVFSGKAQENIKVYDLLNELRTAQHDSTRINIFIALAKEYYPKENDKAINRANSALAMAENNKNEVKIFQALDVLLKCHYKGKFDISSAYKYLNRAKQLNVGNLSLQNQAILMEHEGNIQAIIGNYEKAQTSFFAALDVFEKLNDKNGIANIQYDLGKIYIAQKDHLTAVNYLLKALDLFQQNADIRGRVEVLNALGRTYGSLQSHDKSLQYCSEALYLTESILDQELVSEVHVNMGISKTHVDKMEEAEAHFRTALKIGIDDKKPQIVANAANELGNLFMALKRDTAIVHYFELSLEAATSINDKLLMRNAFQSLYTYYDQKGDRNEAYLYLKQLSDLKEQLSSDEQAKEFIINRIKYESERKEEENKKLIAKELANNLTIQKQRVFNYAMISILLVVSFLGYLLFRSKRKTQASNVVLEEEVKRRTVELLVSNTELQTTNARLEQSNSELERFAYIASHDLKSPLRNIISFLNLIDRKVRKLEDTDLKEYLRFATDNARQMHVLIQDVLEFSRIESDKVTHLESVDLNESLMLVLQNLQEPMQIKGVNVQSPILPVVQTNGVHIMQVFQNLIGNGIKYNESGNPTIQISFSQNSNEYQFAIHDNGIGIAPEYHDQIFEMFKRLHTRDEYKGTGIGLAICKKIVINLGGRIWIDSQVGDGATFFFTIPCAAEKQLAA
jgi:signal transduction histidine kinase